MLLVAPVRDAEHFSARDISHLVTSSTCRRRKEQRLLQQAERLGWSPWQLAATPGVRHSQHVTMPPAVIVAVIDYHELQS